MEKKLKKQKIIVIEDDHDIRNLICFNLSVENYEVKFAADGKEGLALIRREQPDLIVLDIMLPILDGLKILELIKESPKTDKISVIMLTAKGTEEDIVRGLELGADDYVTKPFAPQVLMSRVKAVLRRSVNKNLDASKLVEIYDISLDPQKRKTIVDNIEIKLTYSEFELLYQFTKNPGQVFSRSRLVEFLRGSNHAVTDRSIDVLVVALRKKLQEKGKYIETIRGVGYSFKEESSL